MTRSLFITGTDTGVGKTTVGVALAAALTERAVRVAPFKPAETGCRPSAHGLLAEDALRLQVATGRADLPIDLICPYRYALPVAPAVAAGANPVEMATLLRVHGELSADADLVLVEGAGGLLVPYRDDLLAVDLVRALGAELLIVARASLGTINHTLLTIREAQRSGLRILGIVLNTVSDPGPDAGSNAVQIERHGGVPVLGTFPRVSDLAPAALAATFTGHFPLLLDALAGDRRRAPR